MVAVRGIRHQQQHQQQHDGLAGLLAAGSLVQPADSTACAFSSTAGGCTIATTMQKLLGAAWWL